MKQTLTGMLLCIALAILPTSSSADEAEAKLQIETIATALVPNLPSGKKVVLKTISPEDSGLPADFLGKLTSDLEAALLVASEFEIDLINRQTTEELWAEAIEFNDADFGALHAASGADVALMLTARATEGGVEIALTAYSLDTSDAGKVLASTGSTVLALDMQQNVGVDVNSLNDQMAQVLAEIEKVGQTGGLIADPKTYAEYYHNARILQQRGETDLAMKSYEMAVKNDLQFVDPLIDLIELARTRYGAEGASQYVEKRVSSELPYALKQMAFVMLEQDTAKVAAAINNKEIEFPPALSYWLWEKGQSALAKVDGNSIDPRLQIIFESALLTAARSNIQFVENSGLQSYFIDNLRAIEFAQLERAYALENRLNMAFFSPVKVSIAENASQQQRLKPLICSIQDPGYLFELDLRGGTVDGTEVSYKNLSYSKSERDRICESQFDLLPIKETSSEWIGGELSAVYCFLKDGELPSFERKDTGFFLQGIRKEDVASFIYETNGLFSYRREHFDFPLHMQTCMENQGPGTADSVSRNGNTLTADFLSNLIITDDVSLLDPIEVYYELNYGDVPVSPIDARFDGSFISPVGPAFEFGNADVGYSYQRFNDWFNVPGLLQSSIGQNRILEIRYTDVNGRKKSITNIKEAPLDGIFNATFGAQKTDVDASGEEVAETTNLAEPISQKAQMNLQGIDFDVALIKEVFFQLDQSSREIFQTILFNADLYDDVIDGKWGDQTEEATRGAVFLGRHFRSNTPMTGDGFSDTIDLMTKIQDLYKDRDRADIRYVDPSYSQTFSEICLPENTILTGSTPAVDVLIFYDDCSAHSLINGSGSFCIQGGNTQLKLDGASFTFPGSSPSCSKQSKTLYAACTC